MNALLTRVMTVFIQMNAPMSRVRSVFIQTFATSHRRKPTFLPPTYSTISNLLKTFSIIDALKWTNMFSILENIFNFTELLHLKNILTANRMKIHEY